MNGAIRNWMSRHLYEEAPCTVAVIDPDYHVVEANSRFRRTFGDWEGHLCHELYKHSTVECSDCMAREVFADGRSRTRHEVGVDQAGKVTHYLVRMAPVTHGPDAAVTHVVKMSTDISDAVQAESAYRTLFDGVPAMISILDADYRVIEANRMMRETVGECIGTPCWQAYKGRTSRCDDCPAARVFADGEVHRAEQRGSDRNGRPMTYIVTAAPFQRAADGTVEQVIEMANDITRLRTLQERLRTQAAFQRLLIEHSIDAIVGADETGVLNLLNPAAERLLGISRDEALGQTPLAHFAPKEFERLNQPIVTSCVLPEAIVHHREGEEIPVRASGVVLQEGEQRLGIAAFLQDLRPIKRLECEKLENERLAAVGQTVAGLAHGIKNILMGLEGGMYVMKSGLTRRDETRIERGWEMLERNIERIGSLVKDFLGFSKGMKVNAQPTDPREPATEVVDLYKDAAAEAGIELTLECRGGWPTEIMLDPEAIHTVLANLVSNAIDACRMSKQEQCHIELRVERDGDALCYAVEDDGCGMDYEVKQKVFTNFFTTKGSGGTGLGLLVTRKIVQEHGGRLELESTAGQGTTIEVILPLDRLPAVQEETQPELQTGETR